MAWSKIPAHFNTIHFVTMIPSQKITPSLLVIYLQHQITGKQINNYSK